VIHSGETAAAVSTSSSVLTDADEPEEELYLLAKSYFDLKVRTASISLHLPRPAPSRGSTGLACPHAQPGCPTRGAPPAAARQLPLLTDYLSPLHRAESTTHARNAQRTDAQSPPRRGRVDSPASGDVPMC